MFATNTLAVPTRILRAHFCESSGQTIPAGVVAADRECAAFRLWVDNLAPTGIDALIQLRECGFVYDLDRLETQLHHALNAGPVGPLTRIVAQRLLDLLASRAGAVCLLLEEG
jgi:hypothetical protein